MCDSNSPSLSRCYLQRFSTSIPIIAMSSISSLSGLMYGSVVSVLNLPPSVRWRRVQDGNHGTIRENSVICLIPLEGVLVGWKSLVAPTITTSSAVPVLVFRFSSFSLSACGICVLFRTSFGSKILPCLSPCCPFLWLFSSSSLLFSRRTFFLLLSTSF